MTMPTEATGDRSDSLVRTKSPPSTSNVIVSRSSMQRRKPPRRGASGGHLAEMRREAATFRDRPNTPMSNRQRIATMAAMEMSNGALDSLAITPDDDEESLISNGSTGSEALKVCSPEQQQRERALERSDCRRRRSSSQKASIGRSRRSTGRRSSDSSAERPMSISSLDDGETPRATSIQSMSSTGSRSSTTSNSKSDDSSNRSERHMDRQSTSRQRSSSQKRGERGKRSSSLHEKRNTRSQRIPASKVATATTAALDSAPKSSDSQGRSQVTEQEIMELLSLDYEMPLTEASHETRGRKVSSNSSVARGASPRHSGSTTTSKNRSASRDSRRPSRRAKSPGRLNRRDQSPKPPGSDRSISMDRDVTAHSVRSSRTSASSLSRSRDSNAIRGGEIVNSAHGSLAGRESLSSGMTRRQAPRRTKSEDHGLDTFLQQNMLVSRRKKSVSGSRSVASMPSKARRRRGSAVHSSDKTDETEDTTKASSTSELVQDYEEDLLDHHLAKTGVSYGGGSGNSANGDFSDEEDTASIDLDLATARTFQQQNLNEKLQLHLSKTDELLYSVFPKHVADALRNGQKVEPENHDLVTIFFSDIVGFTDISSKLDPLKISDMLDRLYHSFDALSDYHDVFKVETIGDAYMAVTNLAKKQVDHCKRIAEFAIDAIRVANQTLIDEEDPSMGFVNIRVGFHSGAVVSNVVGTRNPRYCLFGDAVNTASRMESNSQCNRIHCSDISARLLKEQCPKIRIFPRGVIEVKGKGEMKTFWIHTEGSFDAGTSAASTDGKRNIFNNVFNSLRRDKVTTT